MEELGFLFGQHGGLDGEIAPLQVGPPASIKETAQSSDLHLGLDERTPGIIDHILAVQQHGGLALKDEPPDKDDARPEVDGELAGRPLGGQGDAHFQQFDRGPSFAEKLLQLAQIKGGRAQLQGLDKGAPALLGGHHALVGEDVDHPDIDLTNAPHCDIIVLLDETASRIMRQNQRLCGSNCNDRDESFLYGRSDLFAHWPRASGAKALCHRGQAGELAAVLEFMMEGGAECQSSIVWSKPR